MGLLTLSKSKFANAGRLTVRQINVKDPCMDLFLDHCFLILSLLSNDDFEQRHLKIKIVGFYRRLSSFISGDFDSPDIVETFESDYQTLLESLGQFDAVSTYYESFSRSVSRIYERKTNYKLIAVENYISGLDDPENCCAVITRGHKWRTVPVTYSPFGSILTLEFHDSLGFLKEEVITPLSPHLLDSRIMNHLIFGGGASELTVALYGKERLKMPEVPMFIAEEPENDRSLVTYKSIASLSYEVPNEDTITLSKTAEPELFDELLTGDDRLVRILLASDEEIFVLGNEQVWVADEGTLVHMLASDLREGMGVLLRHGSHVEPPEVYLDRSEVWRTPLRNILNTGLSAKAIGESIQNRSGYTVNSRMVLSWVDGSVLGPEDESVFSYLIQELKSYKFLDPDISSETIRTWWDDLRQTRVAQTSKGMANREQILSQVREHMGERQDHGIEDQFEFAEILVLDVVFTNTVQRTDLGWSNRRRMRLFQ